MTRRKFQGAKRVDDRTKWHDAGFDKLMEKLDRWLIQQPEWVAVLSAPRQQRKTFERAVAKRLTDIPVLVRREVPDGRAGSGEGAEVGPAAEQMGLIVPAQGGAEEAL